MKTIVRKIVLTAAAAASVLAAAAPASAAGFGRHDDRGRVERVQTSRIVQRDNGRRVVQVRQVETRQLQNRRWTRGQRFDQRYAHNYRVITNPRAYRLQNAPRGYRWVQSGNDAVMVSIVSGLIGAVLANAF
jgi:Ni/Co efflux regulator RcnB